MNDKDKKKEYTKEEVEEKLKAASSKLIESLLAAKNVAPDDLSEDDKARLEEAIAKAERLAEKIQGALDKEGDEKKED